MFFASSGVLALTMKTTPFPSVRKYHWSILPARYAFTVSCTSCGMIWARWAGVMGVPMKWEIARIFVVGTGGSGLCAEAAPSGVIGFFMAVAPYSSFGGPLAKAGAPTHSSIGRRVVLLGVELRDPYVSVGKASDQFEFAPKCMDVLCQFAEQYVVTVFELRDRSLGHLHQLREVALGEAGHVLAKLLETHLREGLAHPPVDALASLRAHPVS